MPARVGRLPVLVFVAAMIPLAAAVMGLSYRSEVGQAQDRIVHTVMDRNALRARQLNDAVAQQMTALIHLFDMALGQMANSYLESDDHFRVSMDAAMKAFPADVVNLALLVDRDGIVIRSTDGQGLGVSLADRPYIRFLVESGLDRLSIGEPIKSRVLDRWVIPFARPIIRRGRYEGAIVLSVRPEFLNQSLQSISLNANDLIGLVAASGSIMAGNLLPLESIGVKVPETRPYLAPDAPDRGTFQAPSIVDGRPLEFSWLRLTKWPLIVVVGLDAEPDLAPVREAARKAAHQADMVMAGLMAASLTLSALLLIAELRRRHREQEEKRLRVILTTVSDGIHILDPDGHLVLANPSFYRMLGYDPDAPPALHVSDWDMELDRGKASERIRGHMREPAVFSTRHRRRDGSILDVELQARDIQLEGRTYLYAVARDISQRLADEARITHQLAMTGALEAVLRLSLQEKPLLVILDGALEILLNQPWLNIANKAALFLAEDSGKQLRLVANKNLDPAITSACSTIRLGQCLCGQAAAARQPVFKSDVDEDHHIHFEGMEDHGHYSIPILRGDELLGVVTVYVAAGHVRNEDESRFLVMYADTLSAVISRSQLEVKRRSTELDLRATAARLSLVLDTAAEGILGFDDQGRVMFANPAALRLLDWPSELPMQGQPIMDVTGHRLSDGLPCTDRHCHMREVISHGGTHRVADEFFTTRSGSQIPVEYVVSPLEVAGIVVGAVVAFHDISIQKALEAELKSINAELEQFAYVASHDLRQPLRMITSYLKLIHKQLEASLTGELGEFFAFAINGALRMDAMIVGLLEYSRTGRNPVALQPQDLGAVIADSLANLEVALAESGAEITVSPGLPTVMGDRLELTRLFQNLIGNAAKYRLPDRPVRIDLGWRDNGEEWLVWVEDNGIGISADDRERVFAIFQRLVTRELYEGTGIGLAVCKKIVEHHGGRIWVESELGQGSRFLVAFPKALRDAA